MRIAMTILLAAGATLAGGCGPVNPPTGPMFAPGGRMVLTYQTELVSRAWGAAREAYLFDDGTVWIPAEGAGYQTTRMAFAHELLLEVRHAGEQLSLEMTPVRAWLNEKAIEPDGKTHVGEAGDWRILPGEGDPRGYQSLLVSRFSARMAGGRIVKVGATGPALATLEMPADATDSQRQVHIRNGGAGVFSALADALAYQPPTGAKAGTVWQVKRERVYSYQMYAFYMMTHGASHATEHSICRIGRVRTVGGRRIATVHISGRRVPGPSVESMPKRVSHMTLTGRMEVDLDSREIIELTIKTVPSWTTLDDAFMMNIAFTDTIKLKAQ